jgi:hypothetical protein
VCVQSVCVCVYVCACAEYLYVRMCVVASANPLYCCADYRAQVGQIYDSMLTLFDERRASLRAMPVPDADANEAVDTAIVKLLVLLKRIEACDRFVSVPTNAAQHKACDKFLRARGMCVACEPPPPPRHAGIHWHPALAFLPCCL